MGDKVEICQTDTDGLLLYVKTDDFYEDIKPDIDKWFDTVLSTHLVHHS